MEVSCEHDVHELAQLLRISGDTVRIVVRENINGSMTGEYKC